MRCLTSGTGMSEANKRVLGFECGFPVWGLGSWILGLGFGVSGYGFMFWVLGFGFFGFECWFWIFDLGLMFWVRGFTLGFWVWVLVCVGFRILDLDLEFCAYADGFGLEVTIFE